MDAGVAAAAARLDIDAQVPTVRAVEHVVVVPYDARVSLPLSRKTGRVTGR
jgi:hypothetical protein